MRKIIALIGVTALIILSLAGCTPKEVIVVDKENEISEKVKKYVQNIGTGLDGKKSETEMIEMYKYLNTTVKSYYKSLGYGVLVRDPLSKGDYSGYTKSQRFEVIEFKSDDIYNKMDFEMKEGKDKKSIAVLEGEIGVTIDLGQLRTKGFSFNDSVFYNAANNMTLVKLLDREEFNTGVMKYINGEEGAKDSITITNKYYSETIKIDMEKRTIYWTYSFNSEL